MAKTKIQELGELGQSAWLDNINRSMIETGALQKMIDMGLCGMTSNPTIFDKAISKSDVYNDEMVKLCEEGKSSFEIYDDLTVRDIQDACDSFKSVYDRTHGLDGYVSLEINPKLARKTQETIKEGKRLHEKVSRPNLMLKVPSTDEGFEAIRELTACGINVNATLIFSVEQYLKTARSYIKGIEQVMKRGGDVRRVRSVASVFVSRVDTAVDKKLEEMAAEESDRQKLNLLGSLRGKAAASNSNLIYRTYIDMFFSGGFGEYRKKGANPQRLLWGSTSTKNPAYSDLKYVTELIVKDSVNTMPEDTFKAFLDHGEAKIGLTVNTGKAREVIDNLRQLGIDIDAVCEKLQEDGVTAFEKSFDSLLNTIEEKKKGFSRIRSHDKK